MGVIRLFIITLKIGQITFYASNHHLKHIQYTDLSFPSSIFAKFPCRTAFNGTGIMAFHNVRYVTKKPSATSQKIFHTCCHFSAKFCKIQIFNNEFLKRIHPAVKKRLKQKNLTVQFTEFWHDVYKIKKTVIL